MTFMGEILGGEETGKRLDAQSWNLVFHGKGLRNKNHHTCRQGETDWKNTEMGLQRVETLTVDVTDNRLCKAMAWKCHEHFCCTFPPHHIVLWTRTCDGREQQCEVIFTCQFFCRSSMAAQSYEHLDARFTPAHQYPT